MLYVSPYTNFDRSLDVSNAIKDSWSDLWKVANERFKEQLAQDEDLTLLLGKMFFVYEGNHCLTAWWQHINKYYGSDVDWHLSVDCFFLTFMGKMVFF